MVAVAQPSIRLKSSRGRWIIVATALGSGMIFLDTTVVNVALARIQSELSAPLSGLQWIVNAYVLLLAALLLIGGGIGDTFGRKNAFAAGLTLFTLASVACGLAPDLNVLIAARALQGIGGALLVPGSLATIKAVIADQDSGPAIGLWAGMAGVTTAIGPLIGGYLVQAVTWRAIFFLNVPLALATLYAMRHIPANRDENAPDSLDWPGAVATVVGLGGLTYALIEGPRNGWSDPWVVAAMITGVLGVLAFPWREASARHPMIPLRIFRSRNFSGANVATLGVYFALSGVLLFLVLDLQQIQGYTPVQAGIALLPISLLLLFLSPRVGVLIGRFGARPLMTAGPILVAIGVSYLILAGRHPSYPTQLFPGIATMGLGMSLLVTPLATTVMSSVPGALVGIASGVNNMVSRVASLLAIAVLGIVVTTRFHDSLAGSTRHLSISATARSALLRQSDRLADDPLPNGLSPARQRAVRGAIADAYLDGFRWAMAACGVLCLLSAGVSAFTIRDLPHIT